MRLDEPWPRHLSCGHLAAQAWRKHCAAFEVHKMSHRSLPALGNFKAGFLPMLQDFCEAGDL